MNNLFKHLVPYTYKYNTKIDGLETSKETFGVMAQDIRKGIEASGYDADNYSIVNINENGYYSVDYIQLILILILIKEIKILQQKVQTLEGKI